MWRNEKTAFLMIHGAGAHRPFETLDKFVRGFRKTLEEPNGDLDDWRHKLQWHEDWIEHYVSLAPKAKDKWDNLIIDFYEYYWDCHMVHPKINMDDVINWLEKASEGAKRFYKWYPAKERAEEEEAEEETAITEGKAEPERSRQRKDVTKRDREKARDRLFKKDGDFKSGGYLILVGCLSKCLWRLRRCAQFISKVPVPLMGWPGQLIVKSVDLIIKRLESTMASLLQDADIYTCANVRSWKYEIRKKVLDGAVDELKQLLKNDYYDQIIVVGHSLGSVIAYDALNRLILQMKAEGNGQIKEGARKIKGLVTFGSPLDKVAFFFRDIPERPKDGEIYPEEYVRYQILAHHHGFRRRTFKWHVGPIDIEEPANECKLDKAKWLNFYHPEDLIAGELDAYRGVINIPCREQVTSRWWLKRSEAHKVYWTDDEMYRRIAKAFLKE